LVAGILLNRFGARYMVPSGMALLALGCMPFAVPQSSVGGIGRLLQGAGSAFAFTGAVYLASHGFSAKSLATAIGFTERFGMLGGTVGQIAVGPLIHGLVSTSQFWMGLGALVVAFGLMLMTPRENHTTAINEKHSFVTPYKIVLSNVSGLLFAPMTIGDMVWGVRLFRED
jgi:MFS family permease